MKTLPARTLAAFFLLTGCTYTQAAIILSGDFLNGGLDEDSMADTPTLTITEDITFTITSGGNAEYLVFRNWVARDGNLTQAFDNNSQNLEVVNNATITLQPIQSLVDNLTGNFNDMGENDGFLALASPFMVTLGTTVTIKAGTFIFSSNPSFNPALTGLTFTGEVFLADAGSNSRTGFVTVPEPSATFLTLLGAVFLARRKRR